MSLPVQVNAKLDAPGEGGNNFVALAFRFNA